MTSLVLQLTLQIVSILLVYWLLQIDHYNTDKSTSVYQQGRDLAKALVYILLIVSVFATLYSNCVETQDRKIREDKWATDQANYENQIELLQKTNEITNRTIDTLRLLYNSADLLVSRLSSTANQLSTIERKISRQISDISNNSVLLYMEFDYLMTEEYDSRDDALTPALIRWIYNISLLAQPTSQRFQGIASYMDDFQIVESRLLFSNTLFFDKNGRPYAQTTVPVTIILKNPYINGLNYFEDIDYITLLLRIDDTIDPGIKVRLSNVKISMEDKAYKLINRPIDAIFPLQNSLQFILDRER